MQVRGFHSKPAIILISLLLSLVIGACGDEVTSPPDDPESISKPAINQGASTTELLKIEYYCCHEVKSSMDHGLEMQFAWGDNDTSSWHPALCGSHAWSMPGTYPVRARARCSIHPGVLSVWSDPCTVAVAVPSEIITQPDPPAGSSNTIPDRFETYVTSGCVSNLGHSLQYRFDWGDSTTSGWSSADSATHQWSVIRSYEIKAQARCAIHTHVMSNWSQLKEVSVQAELISTPPNPPSGPSYACPDEVKAYTSSDAVSSLGHAVEYRFDWGDGNISPWSASNVAIHSWPVFGPFIIRSQARCATHTESISEWSGGRSIPIVETITAPSRPNGATTATVGATTPITGGRGTSSCTHPREIQWRINDVEQDWPGIAVIYITWTEPGVYIIRLRARCIIHPFAISPWGAALTVVVTN